MPVGSPLPENHPLMIAWKEYQKTKSFENVQRWIFIPEHTHGSQWALFRDGWLAALNHNQSLTTLCEELVEALEGFLGDGQIEIEIANARKALAHYAELLKKKEESSK